MDNGNGDGRVIREIIKNFSETRIRRRRRRRGSRPFYLPWDTRNKFLLSLSFSMLGICYVPIPFHFNSF